MLRGFVTDDAWISVRYAENLARGEGPVWNPGGERVEGYSNPALVASRRSPTPSAGRPWRPPGCSGWPAVAYAGRGFVQYQYVVPLDASAVVRRSIEVLHAVGAVTSLAVLKRFGPGNPGHLSFPTAGWTLAVDVPVTTGTAAVLRELDELVLAAGGRVHLAEDARTSSEALRRMYPRLEAWRAVRDRVDPDRVFTSDLARRLAL